MNRLAFTLFSALFVSSVMAQQQPEGQVPKSGNTYYIYNAGQKAFLSVSGDGITLSPDGSPVTVAAAESSTAGRAEATATADLVTLHIDGSTLALALGNAAGYGAPTEYSQWKLTAADAGSSIRKYHISCRTLEANARACLYYSSAAEGITSTFSGTAGLADAEWIFLSEDDYKRFVTTVELRETATDYTAPSLESGSEAVVHLYRKLTLNAWNSFCIPFSVDNTQLKAQFGDGVQVAEFTSYVKGTLNFTPVNAVEAAKPYLLMPTKVCAADEYYTFGNITEFAEQPQNVRLVDETDNSTCTYTPSFVSTTAPSRTYVLSKNKMYHLTSDMTMKGFRGYFSVESPSGEAKAIDWQLDDSAAGITAPSNSDAKKGNAVYTLGGQLVLRRSSSTADNSLPKGAYIINGKKTIK